MKIRTQLLVLGIVSVITPTLIASYYSLRAARVNLQEQAGNNLTLLATNISNSVTAYTKTYLSLADQFHESDIWFQTDEDGNIIKGQIHDQPYPNLNIQNQPAFQKARQTDKVFIGETSESKALNSFILPIVKPIWSQGRFQGIHVIVLNQAHLNDLINVKVGSTGYAYTFDEAGTVISHPNKDLIFNINVKDVPGMSQIAKRILNSETGFNQYIFRDDPKIAGFTTVPNANWRIIVTQDQKEFLQPIYQVRKTVFLASLLTITFFTSLMFLTVNHILKPIHEAGQALKNIASGDGDLTQRLHMPHNELKPIEIHFNNFIQQVHSIVQTVQLAISKLTQEAHTITTIATQTNQSADSNTHIATTISAATEEMVTNLKQQTTVLNDQATKLQQLATMAEEFSFSASDLNLSTDQTRQAIDDFSNTIQTASKSIQSVQQAVEQTSTNTSQIEEIAKKVHLLALNATLEAARAGEHGKGFHVVAKEIKDLASQTATIVQSISESMTNTTTQTTNIVSLLKQITQQTQSIQDQTNTSSTAINQQTQVSKQMAEEVSDLNQHLQQINEAMQANITVADSVAQDIATTSASMEQLKQATNTLTNSANNITTLSNEAEQTSNQFKV